jgi:hypothetical protein
MPSKRRHYLLINCCLALVVLLFHDTSGQIDQPNRYEVEHKNSDHNFNIISLKEEGMILIRETEKFDDGKKIWEIVRLDSMLTSQWSDKLNLDSKLNMIGYEYLSGQLFLLFRSGEAGTNNLNLLQFSLRTHEYVEYEIKHQFDLRLTHFSIAGSTAIFGGYAVKEPTVVLYSLKEKQVKVVPGFLLRDTELLDLRVNHNQNTFNVLMAERGIKEEKKLYIRTYDESGALLLEDAMVMDKNKTPLAGMTSSLIKDEMVVIGTYGIGASKQANGFFSAMVEPFADQAIRYTDFAQLQHMVDYLGEKKATKIKQAAEKQRQRGKAPSHRNYVSLVRIHEIKTGFLLLAEVYHTSTNLNSTPYWNSYPYNYGYGGNGYGYSPYGLNPYGNRYYNSPYPYQSSQNSEVRMTEGVVVLFDNDAKPEWDESFQFKDVKYSSLEQASDFIETPKGILMAYKKESDILTKLTIPHDNHSLLDTVKIKLNAELDVVKNESDRDGAIKHWYKNYLYTWGYQTIRDRSKQTEDPTRHVFYINKISSK